MGILADSSQNIEGCLTPGISDPTFSQPPEAPTTSMSYQVAGQVDRAIRIYTANAIVDGYLRTADVVRTLDDLNVVARAFVTVHQPELVTGDWSLHEGSVAIRKTSIQFVLEVGEPPRGSNRGQEVRFSRSMIRLQVGQFTIQGFVHLPPGGAYMARIDRERPSFLAFTSTMITGPGEPFAVRFVAVNGKHIHFAQEILPLAVTDEEDSPQTEQVFGDLGLSETPPTTTI